MSQCLVISQVPDLIPGLDLNILSSGSIATTPALSLEEEDYDWGKIGIS